MINVITKGMVGTLFISTFFIWSGAFAEESSLNLLASYDFNGDFRDQSGNRLHGKSRVETFCADRKGRANSAVQLNGLNQSVLIPVNINPRVHPKLTICAWVRVEDAENGGTVVSNDNGGFDRTINLDRRGNKHRNVEFTAFCGSHHVVGSKPVKQDEWYFVAATYDQVKERIVLCVNLSRYHKDGRMGPGHNQCRIGSNPSHGSYFKGAIDDVRIYGKVLSSKELKAVMEDYK